MRVDPIKTIAQARIDFSKNIRSQVAATPGGWGENVLILALVLAPLGLAVIVMAIGGSTMAAWQVVRELPVKLPTSTTIQLYGQLCYAVVSWIDVAVVGLWSWRRGFSGEVFAFRILTRKAIAASIVGFVVAMYAVPIMTDSFSRLTGGQSHGVRIDFQDTRSVAIFIFLFVVTTPVSEEILYRGLLVAGFRRIGCGDTVILLASSLIFGANHLIPLGFIWSVSMIGLGAILCGLRLRYHSLSPGWLAHVLFNAQPFLSYPLIAWLAPALLPGHS